MGTPKPSNYTEALREPHDVLVLLSKLGILHSWQLCRLHRRTSLSWIDGAGNTLLAPSASCCQPVQFPSLQTTPIDHTTFHSASTIRPSSVNPPIERAIGPSLRFAEGDKVCARCSLEVSERASLACSSSSLLQPQTPRTETFPAPDRASRFHPKGLCASSRPTPSRRVNGKWLTSATSLFAVTDTLKFNGFATVYNRKVPNQPSKTPTALPSRPATDVHFFRTETLLMAHVGLLSIECSLASGERRQLEGVWYVSFPFSEMLVSH